MNQEVQILNNIQTLISESNTTAEIKYSEVNAINTPRLSWFLSSTKSNSVILPQQDLFTINKLQISQAHLQETSICNQPRKRLMLKSSYKRLSFSINLKRDFLDQALKQETS